MSIRPLLLQGRIQGIPTESVNPVQDLSIAFALDSGYLMPFKVMLTSMVRAGTLLDCPIVIYSDDEKLFEDPIVKLVCDRPVLLQGARKERLYELARDSVFRQERRGDWNRGTFLKWGIFEPQPTSNLLFLDVDMVVLRPLEGIMSLGGDANLLTAPQFQTDLAHAHPQVVYEALRAMIDGSDFPERHRWRINSGMMLVRRDFLSEEFFSEITRFAMSEARVHEQAHFSEYFYTRPGHRMIAAAYNCQEQWLRKVSADQRAELLNSVHVLHFAGPNKPWKKRGFTQKNDARRYWHQAARAGRAFVAAPKAKQGTPPKVKAKVQPGKKKAKGVKVARKAPLLKRVVKRVRRLLKQIVGH